jgi:hypothetical protein
VVDFGRGPVEELAGGGGSGLHVGELELDPLQLVDRLAEGRALACVGGRVIGGAPGRCRAPARRSPAASGRATRALALLRALHSSALVEHCRDAFLDHNEVVSELDL